VTDPIGALIVTAERQAKKKAGGTHEAQAECGCKVLISWLEGKRSYLARITRCTDHPSGSTPL
jgi:hypothetical protein